MINPGDMVSIGGRTFTVAEVRPSGKLKLSTGAIVPAAGVRLVSDDAAKILRRSESLRLDRQIARATRDVAKSLIVLDYLSRNR